MAVDIDLLVVEPQPLCGRTGNGLSADATNRPADLAPGSADEPNRTSSGMDDSAEDFLDEANRSGDEACDSIDRVPASTETAGEEAASIIVLENGEAVEFFPRWESGRLHQHDVVLGVVTRHVPHLGGVFVRVGGGHDGLLRLKPDETPPAAGSRIIVTIQRESRAHSQTGGSAQDPAAEAKGPILSRQLALASRHAVFRPSLPPLRRTFLKSLPAEVAERRFAEDLEALENRYQRLLKEAESGPAPRVLVAAGDPLLVLAHAFANRLRSIQAEGVERYRRVEQLLQTAAPDLLPRLKLHPPHFTYSLATVHRVGDLARQVCSRRVRLPCGGTLVFDRTEALHVIDVNSGACQGASPAALADRVNREAVQVIARQLRLRNLSGMILVDLIHQKDPARREAHAASLREAAARDRGGVTVYGFSALNLLELVRKAH